jgi:RNA polymerase sigma-70 factor (ECF subfamily)
MTSSQTDDAARIFAEHRSMLVGVAYRILGSIADAEDAVQDAWLRWAEVDQHDVERPRAYLITIVTRQAINRVRQQQRRRESYIGPWLPEPLPDLQVAGADTAVELADSLSMAMLVILQTLSPAERAAFVLREVFGFGYDEIAGSLDRSPAAVRQLVSRARQHVRADSRERPVSAAEHRQVAEEFLLALRQGSIDRLLPLLDPDAVLISDGGGKRKAALRPIRGARKILRFLSAVLATEEVSGMWPALVTVNGQPAVQFGDTATTDSLGFIEILDGRITELYLIRNPDKLGRIEPHGG